MKRREFIKNAGIISLASYIPKTHAQIHDIQALSLDGDEIILSRADLLDFMSSFQGSVITKEHYDYETARLVWNGVWDKRPALIVFCESPSDIQKAVNFSREQNLLTAIRSGGHSISGKSTCDGGIIIDLSRMRKTNVDLQRKIVTVEAGCTLYDMDSKTLPYGYVAVSYTHLTLPTKA